MIIKAKPSVSTRHRVAKLVLASLMVVIAVTLITFSVRAWRLKTDATAKPARIAFQATPSAGSYVQRGRLWPQLQDALIAFGDRLERPGKERLILTGTLSRKPDDRLAARLILEYPDKLRLEEPDGITVFDGKLLKSSKRNFNKKEEDEIESLLSDSVEHFFAGQMAGRAMLFLGQRFRTDDGTTPNYRGPYYDIYQVEDQITIKKELGRQTKLFYINSDTLLLERVRFEEKQSRTKVEVQFSNWQRIDGQFIPGKINRFENGVIATGLSISSAVIGSRVTDSIFSQP